jgi:pimeloyl-ACP methyl ester carboxylesterase
MPARGVDSGAHAHSPRAAVNHVTNLATDGHHSISGGRLSPPETWSRRAYRNLIYFHEVDKGGHFAAWKQPQLFATEFRAAFKSVREAH